MSAFIVRITLNDACHPQPRPDAGRAAGAARLRPVGRCGSGHRRPAAGAGGSIHKASHLFAEGPAPATPVNMVRNVRPGKTLTADMVRPQRAGKKIANVMIHRGDFKSLMDGYTARMPRALWAFGRGDAAAGQGGLGRK